MPKPRLEQRSWTAVIGALLLAPATGAVVVEAGGLGLLALGGYPAPRDELGAFLSITVAFIVTGFFWELVTALPLVLAFRRYRWAWLTGWSMAGLGFIVAAVPGVVLSLTLDSSGHAEALGYAVNGHLTSAGWQARLSSCAKSCLFFGLMGVVAALVLRWVAFRVARDPADTLPSVFE